MASRSRKRQNRQKQKRSKTKPNVIDEIKQAEVLKELTVKRDALQDELTQRLEAEKPIKEVIKSPCVGRCSLDSACTNYVCSGCSRTLPERLEWNQYSDSKKTDVLLRIEQYRLAFGEEAWKVRERIVEDIVLRNKYIYGTN